MLDNLHSSMRPSKRANVSTTIYPIRDAKGSLEAKHIRVDNPDGTKRFWWELPDGSKNLNGTRLEDLASGVYSLNLIERVSRNEAACARSAGT